MNFPIDFTPVHVALHHAANRYASGDSFRIFHGRGGCYEDLHWCAIDYFDGLWVATLYAPTNEETEQGLFDLLVAHMFATGAHDSTLLVQRRYLDGAPWQVIIGAMPEEGTAKRGNLQFALNFNQQNLGFFLDIEPARKWLEKTASNKRVLNMFSYTCAFSVVAMAAGADSVVNIDMSRRSLDVGRKNHYINKLDTQAVKFLPHNIFKSWGKLRKLGPYDVVIVDPPSFQKGSFIATKDYAKVVRKLTDLVEVGGHALLCLNSPEISFTAFHKEIETVLSEDVCAQEGKFELEQKMAACEDFAESSPDHGALKILAYRRVA